MNQERWTRERFLADARERDTGVDDLLAMKTRDAKPYRVLVECDCDYEGCHGWAIVTPGEAERMQRRSSREAQ